MHLLRFPNSSIRAKQKEMLPAEEGRPHACCLHAEVASHGQTPCRGDRLRPGPLQGAAARRGNSPQGEATRGHGQLRPARKGLPPADSPVASRGGGPASRVVTPWQGGCGGAVRVKEG
ncbi:hypothetical protein GW17_00031397 [Ensete ventricosum]|nr:hypothetical protein GW17_00031397 [Ensete ventricosum]